MLKFRPSEVKARREGISRPFGESRENNHIFWSKPANKPCSLDAPRRSPAGNGRSTNFETSLDSVRSHYSLNAQRCMVAIEASYQRRWKHYGDVIEAKKNLLHAARQISVIQA